MTWNNVFIVLILFQDERVLKEYQNKSQVIIERVQYLKLRYNLVLIHINEGKDVRAFITLCTGQAGFVCLHMHAF